MNKRRNYSNNAFFIFMIRMFFMWGLFHIGVFSRYQYLTMIKATTGTIFRIVLGNLKLKFQILDTLANQDCGGIMLNKNNLKEIYRSYNEDYTSSELDYYYVLTGKVVRIEKSDKDSFHPLIEVTLSYKISKILFGILTIVKLTVLIFFVLYYTGTS